MKVKAGCLRRTGQKNKIILFYRGCLIDSVQEIVSIEEKQIASTPSIFKGLKPEYIKGIGKISDRLIVILSLDNLLTSEEMILLGESKGGLSPKNRAEK